MKRKDFRKEAGTTNLKKMLGIESLHDLDFHQLKAYTNFKYCAQDAWQFVNDCLDHTDGYEESKALMTSPKKLYDYIYDEALTNVYAEGMSSWGRQAEAYIKDIRFCGKEFLQKLAYYFTMKDIEEAFEEVDGDEADEERITTEIAELKAELNF